MNDTGKLGLSLLALLVAVVALVQLVPYGRRHENPPDGALVTWDSPETQRLAERACYDCHSNHTRWPWYASIAPISWRLQTHVNEGRRAINFTAFDPANEHVAEAAGESGEKVTKGEMPPNDYLLMHPEARLTSAEKQTLVSGLDRTFAAFAEKGEHHGRSAATMDGVKGAGEGSEAGEHERGEHEEHEGHESGDRD